MQRCKIEVFVASVDTVRTATIDLHLPESIGGSSHLPIRVTLTEAQWAEVKGKGRRSGSRLEDCETD